MKNSKFWFEVYNNWFFAAVTHPNGYATISTLNQMYDPEKKIFREGAFTL